jgi:hypothetical protein
MEGIVLQPVNGLDQVELVGGTLRSMTISMASSSGSLRMRRLNWSRQTKAM